MSYDFGNSISLIGQQVPGNLEGGLANHNTRSLRNSIQIPNIPIDHIDLPKTVDNMGQTTSDDFQKY